MFLEYKFRHEISNALHRKKLDEIYFFRKPFTCGLMTFKFPYTALQPWAMFVAAAKEA